MSLTELSTAIPVRLPAQLNFADSGYQFQAVQSKHSVPIQPVSGNTFSPDGIRVIRFVISGEGYFVPESLRMQALFSVLKCKDGSAGGWKPLAPMSCLFERVRVISNGQVLSDENYFDRLQSLQHEMMEKEQFEEICAESFNTKSIDGPGEPAFDESDALHHHADFCQQQEANPFEMVPAGGRAPAHLRHDE